MLKLYGSQKLEIGYICRFWYLRACTAVLLVIPWLEIWINGYPQFVEQMGISSIYTLYTILKPMWYSNHLNVSEVQINSTKMSNKFSHVFLTMSRFKTKLKKRCLFALDPSANVENYLLWLSDARVTCFYAKTQVKICEQWLPPSSLNTPVTEKVVDVSPIDASLLQTTLYTLIFLLLTELGPIFLFQSHNLCYIHLNGKKHHCAEYGAYSMYISN